MYRINEIFYSLQGEGCFTGTPAVFIRFSGCNRACGFCDTDFAAFTEMTSDAIIAEVGKFPARHIVLTGGEPTLQIDDELMDKLAAVGYYIQIETNGSLPVHPKVNWVTCSPKARPWGIDRVDELKVVYLGHDIEDVASYFAAACNVKVFSLQPCSGQNIPETVEYVKTHPRWRLSLQTHKLIDIR